MILFATAQLGINLGDIIFQLLSFLILLGIPFAVVIFLFKRRNSRLNRIEEKLDRLLEENENRKKGEKS